MNTQGRFKDALWFKRKPRNISIGGLGGTGSWTALFLSRLLIKQDVLHLYDDDNFDITNMAGQFVSHTEIDQLKVIAISKLLDLFSPNKYTRREHRNKFTESSYATEVMFSCFDNMLARTTMFEKWCAYESKEIFIDQRLEAESFRNLI